MARDRSEDPRERLIVALDFPSVAQALALVDRLDGRCVWFKVGLELYLGGGRSILDILVQRDFKVFLDLKLHDIPNTVAGAVRALASSGASLLTLHAAGGPAMLAAAAEAAAAAPAGPKLLAVTVLTSVDAAELARIGVPAPPAEQVARLARIAVAAGIGGLVCSPAEAALLRRELGESPLLVVPGVRPAGAPLGDQRRVATPAEAIHAGASMLVVGRPITGAANPQTACESILNEIAHAG